MQKLRLHRFINSLFSSNTYLLYKEDEDFVWLVDCGDVEPIIEWCKEKERRVEGVFITHSHFDHIYGLCDLLSYFPNVRVYTSLNGRIGLSSSRYNMSLYHEEPFEFKGESIILFDGDKMSLYPSIDLWVYETPGHDWSCLSYLVDNNYFFTGDSYIPGLKIVTNFPKSDKQRAIASLGKIQNLTKYCVYICPGHENIQQIRK